MKKSELRTGDKIIRRDGEVGAVLLNSRGYGDITRMGRNTWAGLNDYNVDLTSKHNYTQLDIMEVHETHANGETNKLLWKREEVLEVTMADLEAKYNCKVKVIK